MSTRLNSKKSTFVPINDLPGLTALKTEWDLEGLYYKNDNDSRIEEDVVYAISVYTKFAKKWRHSAFTNNPSVLAAALKDYEKIAGDARISKPGRYFSLRGELDVTDMIADKAQARLRKRLRPASDAVLFFTLDLGKIPKATQTLFLKHDELKSYRYFLQQIFASAKYDLSLAEEKIIRLKAMPASGLWHQMTEKLISSAEITYKGKSLPIPEALERITLLPSAEKPKLWSQIITKVDSFGTVAEHEFNAIIGDVRNEDELRGYKKPYSATALGYQHSEESIEALVSAVSTKGFALSRKFYEIKAAYHGASTLSYSQKYDPIGTPPIIPFSEALTICRDVFYGVNTLYGQLFDTMIERGQIDVYPKKGKRGGAFMSDQTGHPIQVMLNHTDSMKALETLAHEMGHAVHASRSSLQSPLYDGHSIVTAETASTLFENLVFQALYKEANEETKKVLLHDKIAGDIATMQRQITFFNCELEIHNTIHADGAMSHEELRDCMTKHLKAYLGPAVSVAPIDGSSYVFIPHLRYGFYVYSYTFGNLMSTIMASEYAADTNYRSKIDKFLSAGQSANVVNIFKSIGLDTTKADTFTTALKAHEKDIATFKKLVSKKAELS